MRYTEMRIAHAYQIQREYSTMIRCDQILRLAMHTICRTLLSSKNYKRKIIGKSEKCPVTAVYAPIGDKDNPIPRTK